MPALSTAAHPLDPLTAEEIESARTILDEAGLLGPEKLFGLVQLQEPLKADVAAFDAGEGELDRRVFIVILDIQAQTGTEYIVSVTHRRVDFTRGTDTSVAPYGQPGMVMSEFMAIDEIVKADERWQAAMAARGVDTTHVVVTGMTAGNFGHEFETGRRVWKAITLYREAPEDNPWARPVEGVVATVDIATRTVVDLSDYGSAPLPPGKGIFTNGKDGEFRDDLKPLVITQPEGPSFSVDGRHVTWQNWDFRIGFDIREGLVMHDLAFTDAGKRRPIMFRGSISEMVVPYGDPHPMRSFINYFDAGEYNLGRLATSLTLGCDCVGDITYFDATVADEQGHPEVMRNVICMHEEDYGVLWKHVEGYNDVAATRRSRRLVVSFFAAIGNYDYGYFWYLYQDGTIQFEAKLTGIVFANAQADDIEIPYAARVAPGLVAPFHQHLFCARLDMNVDGAANRVEELEVFAEEISETNPFGNAFQLKTTLIGSESESARLADPSVGRYWKVSSATETNAYGKNTSYKLVPHAAPTLLMKEGSSIRARAAFATKHLWVTQFDSEEKYAAGLYPNQHQGGAGLPEYVAQDRSLDGEDVVLWHTFGATHITRPEDWPVMPVEYTGFTMKPVGFFDQNPALDVPDPMGGTCSGGGGLAVGHDGTNHGAAADGESCH
ncbi:primary-amine oxidase [Nocardioides sp. GY 10127]|nr:primary-amine oxidase [Nocardioides sp. GY 10127]